jgi:hypothetical protein
MAHPKSGFYVKDGKEYVSQSTVVGETNEFFDPGFLKGLEIWRSKEPDADQILADSCRRGTLVHHTIDTILNENEVEELEEPTSIEEMKSLKIADYMSNAKEMLDWMKKYSEPVIEEVSYSEKYGFACTKDFRGYLKFKKNGWEYELCEDGEPIYSVLDLKTIRYEPKFDDDCNEIPPKAKPRSYHSSNFPQLGANALAFNEEVKAGIVDAPLIEQGVICALYQWRAPRFHIFDFEQLKQESVNFLKRLRTYEIINNTKFPRPIQKSSPVLD